MADQRLDPSGQGGGVAGDAQLAQDGELVEVDPLAEESILIKDEEGQDRQLILPPVGGRLRSGPLWVPRMIASTITPSSV